MWMKTLEKPEANTDREIARKVGMEVHMHFPAIWKALEAMKMQDGLGASPKGQRRPERPYNSWTEPETNSDRENFES